MVDSKNERIVTNRINRAKQFLPFDALKGFQEILKQKEIEYEDRKELAEDSYVELDAELNRVEEGEKVKIRYYKNRRYIDKIGTVTKIDYIRKKIQLNGEENINVCDIIKIFIV